MSSFICSYTKGMGVSVGFTRKGNPNIDTNVDRQQIAEAVEKDIGKIILYINDADMTKNQHYILPLSKPKQFKVKYMIACTLSLTELLS